MVLQDLVDVIIPSYQETHLLLRAIDSALSQGSVVNNIFVVDDGSDESTRLFVSKYVEPKAKVRVLYSNRVNHPGIARNIGLEHCTSEWVAFLDADDIWMADKLEKQLLFAEKFAFDFVASNATVHDSTPTVKEYFDPHTSISLNSKSLVMNNQVINSTTIVPLFKKYSVPSEPDFVSIDIDSVDMWVMRAMLKSYKPRVVMVCNFFHHAFSFFTEIYHHIAYIIN
jgi:glycosyltransferase involved in cell wall biosynthesis